MDKSSSNLEHMRNLLTNFHARTCPLQGLVARLDQCLQGIADESLRDVLWQHWFTLEQVNAVELDEAETGRRPAQSEIEARSKITEQALRGLRAELLSVRERP